MLPQNQRAETTVMTDLTLEFTAVLWASAGPGAWHFLTLPADGAAQIRFFRQRHHGFGTLRVTATIGGSRWATSLFPDKTSGSFFLPVKAEVRRREGLRAGDTATVKPEPVSVTQHQRPHRGQLPIPKAAFLC